MECPKTAAPCTCNPFRSQPVREIAKAIVALALGAVPVDRLRGEIMAAAEAKGASCTADVPSLLSASAAAAPGGSLTISGPTSGHIISFNKDGEASSTYMCIKNIASGAAAASDSMRRKRSRLSLPIVRSLTGKNDMIYDMIDRSIEACAKDGLSVCTYDGRADFLAVWVGMLWHGVSCRLSLPRSIPVAR